MAELDLKNFFGDTATKGEGDEEDVQDDNEDGENQEVIEDDTDTQDDEETEEEDSEEDSDDDEVDETELKRRDYQSKADQLEHQNKLLLAKLEEKNAKLLQANQTEDEEDDFAGLPDDELLTVAQMKELSRKKSKQAQDIERAQRLVETQNEDQVLWMQTQPDFQEVDKFYIDNKVQIDQMLQVGGNKGTKNAYLAIRAEKHKSEKVTLANEIKSLKKQVKKLKKTRGKVPQTGPGGVSISPGKGQKNLDMGGFFGRDWNR